MIADCRPAIDNHQSESKMSLTLQAERLPRRRRPRQPGVAHAPRRGGARPRRPRPLRPARSRATCSTSRPQRPRKVCVRDLPGQHPDKYPHIHNMLIDVGEAGQTVVRLKGGDPLIFGRGGEEAEALRSAGSRLRDRPRRDRRARRGGVSSKSRSRTATTPARVALVTGHELPNKPGNRLDWKALAAFPGTLAIYMGIARLPVIVARAAQARQDARHARRDRRARVVGRTAVGLLAPRRPGGSPPPRGARSAGADPRSARRSRSAPPQLVVRVAAALRPSACWSRGPPTRPRGWSASSKHLGAVVSRLARSRFANRPTSRPLDRALGQLRARRMGLARLHQRKRRPRPAPPARSDRPRPPRPRRREARRDRPEDGRRASRVSSPRRRRPGGRVLVRGAGRGTCAARRGAARVARPGQPRPRTAPRGTGEDRGARRAGDGLRSGRRGRAGRRRYSTRLRRGEIRYVTLPSSNIARGVLGAFDETIRGRIERGEMQLVAISPETGKAVRELGYPVAAEAEVFTEDGLIDAVVRARTARAAQKRPATSGPAGVEAR